ncbi:hypothetical protein BH23GEM9_BH23GEM9_34500 [soil metagenome]
MTKDENVACRPPVAPPSRPPVAPPPRQPADTPDQSSSAATQRARAATQRARVHADADAIRDVVADAAAAVAVTDPPADAVACANADAVIRRIAEGQHGVVGRLQLINEGVPDHVVNYRVKRRRLEWLYRGVYRVGPVKAQYEAEAAALLASGATAVLSHGTAVVMWGMLAPPRPAAALVHVSIRDGNRAPGAGVRVHRVRRLEPDEITTREGLPITSPARTLLDLAGYAVSRDLEQAVAYADREGLVRVRDIERLLARYPRRAGTSRLRALVAGGNRPSLTRSEAETCFLELIRKAQLARPAPNVPVRGYEVDFLWRAERLIVEIDGYKFHSSSTAFERDRRRDADLTAAGFRVIRVTWRQLTREPEVLLVRLAQLMARTSAPRL